CREDIKKPIREHTDDRRVLQDEVRRLTKQLGASAHHNSALRSRLQKSHFNVPASMNFLGAHTTLAYSRSRLQGLFTHFEITHCPPRPLRLEVLVVPAIKRARIRTSANVGLLITILRRTSIVDQCGTLFYKRSYTLERTWTVRCCENISLHLDVQMVMGMGLNGDSAVVLVQKDMEMYTIFHESPLCDMLARMMFWHKLDDSYWS
ncbi:hypothetical protein JG687_00019021, partial [Phytophthora cactorum]